MSTWAAANDLTEWSKLVGTYRSQDYFRCAAMNLMPSSCYSSAKMGTSRWIAQKNGQHLTGLVIEMLFGYWLGSTEVIQLIVPAEVGETRATSTGLYYRYNGPLQVNCGSGLHDVEVAALIEAEYLSSDKKQFRLNVELNSADTQCSGTFSKILTRI